MGRPKKDPNVVVPKNAKALVWTHFGDSLDGVHAHCLLCKNVNNNNIVSIKVLDGSTKSLWNHIHRELVDRYLYRHIRCVRKC